MKFLALTRAQLFILCSVILGIMFYTTGNIGVNSSQHNSEYFIYGSSSPTAVIGGLLLGIIAFCFQSKNKPNSYISKVPLWKRAFSMFIDALISMSIIVPITVIPVLVIEAFYTGHYAWYFERAFMREYDFSVVIIGVFMAMFWIMFYFSYFISCKRQSVGHYIMGYQITNRQDVTLGKAMLHNLFGFLILCLWIITVPMAAINSKKQFLHEDDNGYFAEMLVY